MKVEIGYDFNYCKLPRELMKLSNFRSVRFFDVLERKLEHHRALKCLYGALHLLILAHRVDTPWRKRFNLCGSRNGEEGAR